MDRMLTHREALVERADSGARILELSFASENPVQRLGYLEVLDLARMDLDRLNRQSPLLFNHDPDQLVGGVVQGSARIENGKARARVRFSKSDQGFNAFRDAMDGNLGISVGYVPSDPIDAGRAHDGRPVRRFASAIYEISMVSIPADTTVGVGRSASIPTFMPDPIVPTAAAPAAPSPAPATQTRSDDAQRIMRYGMAFPSQRDQAVRAVAGGMSFNDFVDGLRGSDQPSTVLGQSLSMPSFSIHGSPLPDRLGGLDDISRAALSGGYSLRTLCVAAIENRPVAGLELELSRELEKRGGTRAKGTLVPLIALASRSFVSNIGQLGGVTVATDVLGSDLIEFLRPLSKVLSLGARTLGGLVGNVSIPRLETGGVAQWVAETSPAPESGTTFGQVALTRKTLSIYGEYSKELLLQSSLDVESVLRSDFAAALGQEIDRAALHGDGTGPTPRGIAATTAINTVTFGGPATWAKVVEFETALAVANVESDASTGWLTSPGVRAKWRQINKAATAPAVASSYLWADDADRVLNYRAEVSGNVEGDAVFFGHWADLLIGFWSGMDVVVDPYSKSRSRLITITSSAFTDIALRHPESFAMSADSGAQ